MRAVLVDREVLVSRPVKCSEMRIIGLENNIPAEVVAAIARVSGCPEGEINIVEIWRFLSGLGSVWVSCLTSAAKKVADGGHLVVGWVGVRVEELPP